MPGRQWAPGLALVTDCLAVYRVTRLVTEDSITQPLRQRVHRAARNSESKAVRFAEELVDCPWCVGMWVSLAAATASRIAPRAWRTAATTLTYAAVAGLIAERM